MSVTFHDRVKETTTTTGTGNITLAGAVSQFTSFSSRYSTGSTNLFPYAIVGQTGTEWEVGLGYLSAATTLVRSVVLESSNADAAVTFSAGTKDVFVTWTGRNAESALWSMTDGITAAGSTQGTATAITDTINSVGTVAASTGVILPAGKPGDFITVSNHGANALNVYPATGETVEGLAANAPLVLLPGQAYRAAVPTAGNWVGIDMNPWDDETSSFMLNAITTDPATPPSGSLRLYSKVIAGRTMLKIKPPSGVDNPLQTAFFGNNIEMFIPMTGTVGIGTGTGGAVGPAWTSNGTVTHPTPSSTAPAISNQMKRTMYANVATTTNQQLGPRRNVASDMAYWRGNAAGLGGFFFFTRFIVELYPASTVRIFAGLTGASATASVCISDTVVNDTCGLWHDTTDPSTGLGAFNFVTRNTVTTTKQQITLANAIAAKNSYDFFMYCPPNGSTIYWRLDDIVNGVTYENNTSTTLPTATTFMQPQVQMSNGTANVTVTTSAIGINKIYVESDH